MPKNVNSINQELFSLLKSHGYKPTSLSTAGSAVPDPSEAEVFQFDFIKDGKNYGKVTITIDDLHKLIVYYGDEVADSEKEESSNDDISWYQLLKHLKRFAQKFQLSWELQNTENLSHDMAKREHAKKKDKLGEGKIPALESDISGLLAAARLNRSFIITAQTAEGQTKKYRVKAQSANVAKEKFMKHHSMAKIIDVKEEGVSEDKYLLGRMKYEQMKNDIGEVIAKLYHQGVDGETIGEMGYRVAQHLGYEPSDPIYRQAWSMAFTDANLEGDLDEPSDDEYARRSMRQGELGLMPMREGMAGGLSWSSLDEGLSIEDKMSIFEEYYTKGNLTESIDEDKKSYFVSLFKMSDIPTKNNKYIVVPLSLVGNKILQLDKPKYITYIGKSQGQLVFKSSQGELRYPSETMRDISVFNTFTFSTQEAYDKFRVALSLKFDTELPNINLVKKGITEMDKSAPQSGRDGKVSHSTYGTRDKKGSDYFKGKESPGKAITTKQAQQDALDILKKQGVAEGSKQRLPLVMYKEISPDMMQGNDLYQVVQSHSPFWKVGATFSDDDMSMGSRQVRFISDTGKEHGVAEGSEMIWIVYRQETTLYPSGERDHETEIVKTFTNDNEAEAYADKLNSTNRDEDVYYFVRGKRQGVAEGADKLQGTPVVSLKDFDDKDTKKDKYGRKVPKKLKKDDPRVKFHKDEKQGVAEGLTKQARARKEAESVKAAIERLEQQLKDPNPHIDKDDIRRRLETEKRRLELYRDVLDEQGVAEGSGDKIHLKTPKHGLADHPGRNTGVGQRTFSQTPEQDRCSKCNSLFKNHYKQGVAEEHNDTFDPKTHQYKTTMKHAKNPTVQQRMAAHDIKPGVAGYRDRIDLLKDLEHTGRLKEQGVETPQVGQDVVVNATAYKFGPKEQGKIEKISRSGREIFVTLKKDGETYIFSPEEVVGQGVAEGFAGYQAVRRTKVGNTRRSSQSKREFTGKPGTYNKEGLLIGDDGHPIIKTKAYKNWLKQQAGGKEQGVAEGKESMKQVNEGYYPMGKQGSYSDAVPTTKIILQHTRKIEEGEQRYRNIAKIFVENMNGERFLIPTTKPGIARVYARHIAEGGTPYDERGKHITSLVEEYSKMAGFVRATKNKQFNESAQQLVNEGVNHYQSLRETLHKMCGHRGYNAYFESYTPTLVEDGEEQSNLNELFVQETLDPRIESVMPILSRLHKNVSEMKETNDLAEWADNLIGEATDLKTIPEKAEDGPIKDLEDLRARRKAIQDLQVDPDTAKDPALRAEVIRRKAALEKEAKARGFVKEETLDEAADVPIQVRSLYAQTYAKYAKTASAAKSAKQMAYATVEKKFGKEMTDKLKAYHDQNTKLDEGASAEDIVSIILRRVMLNPSDLVSDALRKYGPDYIVDKVGEVADRFAGAEEIGSSDISAMVEEFMRTLEDDARYGVDEDLDANQKRVGQLGPTEKAKTISPVLGKEPKQHPFQGKLVGAESAEPKEEMLEGEDHLAAIKRLLGK